MGEAKRAREAAAQKLEEVVSLKTMQQRRWCDFEPHVIVLFIPLSSAAFGIFGMHPAFQTQCRLSVS
jgi:hypothetical protein